jgi:quinol-cytochrome oxidoreductase complex cytochrome b subunit
MGEQAYRLTKAIKRLPHNLKASVFRHGIPSTDHERSEAVFGNFFLHLHPVKIHQNTLRLGYTLGLGLISFYLFIILVGSGILLMFYYVPSTELAYRSMKDIEFIISSGMVLRNIHRWAAHGMIVTVFLHMWRVFATGAYKYPREFNWVIGISLLMLTVLLSFTGYLLPWDQLAFWAITVGTSIVSYVPFIGEELRYLILGGNVVGQNALLRFYVLHCVVFPLFLGVLIGVHFWRIRKDGGLSRPMEDPDEGVSVVPEGEIP